MNFSRGIGFNPALGSNRSVSFPPHHDHPGLNLSLNHAFLTDDEHPLPVDFTGEFPIYANRPFEGQLPLKFCPPTQQSVDLLIRILLSFFSDLPPLTLSPEQLNDSIQFFRRIILDFDFSPFLLTHDLDLGSQGALELLHQ